MRGRGKRPRELGKACSLGCYNKGAKLVVLKGGDDPRWGEKGGVSEFKKKKAVRRIQSAGSGKY